MNKKLLIGSCGLAAVAGNVFAAEEDVSYFNPYASLKGGYAVLSKRNDIKYKGGFAGAVELGVSYDAWRLGLELGYRSSKIKEVNRNPFGMNTGSWFLLGNIQTGGAVDAVAKIEGHSLFRASAGEQGLLANHWYLRNAIRLQKINALTGMVNVCYDYALTDAWSMYAGVGFGVAKVAAVADRALKLTDIDCSARAAANPPHADIPPAVIAALKNDANSNAVKEEHSKTVFAWQLMAGVGYEFDENWKLTFGYKLFNTAKVKLFGNDKIKTPFNHTFEAGLTYTF